MILNIKVFACAAQQKWSTSNFHLQNTFVELTHNSFLKDHTLLMLKKIQHWSCGRLQFTSRLTNVIYGEDKLVKVQAKAKHKGLQTRYASVHPRSPCGNTCREVGLILSICVMASIPQEESNRFRNVYSNRETSLFLMASHCSHSNAGFLLFSG